jgi:hypothetical protein
MSTVSEGLRRQVTARAGNCCEYCHLPTAGQVGRFPIDHVIPQGLLLRLDSPLQPGNPVRFE